MFFVGELCTYTYMPSMSLWKLEVVWKLCLRKMILSKLLYFILLLKADYKLIITDSNKIVIMGFYCKVNYKDRGEKNRWARLRLAK